MTQNYDSEMKTLYEKADRYQQEHIFRFWNKLTNDQKGQLISQIKSVDFDQLNRLKEMALSGEHELQEDMVLETADIVSLKDRKQMDPEAVEIGEEALREGKVAAFLVAGGQGSRLGFDGPKGMYRVTPVKKKSLFQVFAEKLKELQKRYNCTIPWYIMTSVTNHNDTIAFFKEQNHFSLDPARIKFFNQDMVPAIDKNGKMILDAPDHVFMNPNGHGGSLKALWDSGAIKEMETSGIQYIFYFQVDNVLTKICDPAFLGYHIKAESDMSNKVVRKAYPEEKMGIICRINGKVGLVEYSDLPEQYMYAKDNNGELKYWAGSIATHVLDVDFVKKQNQDGFKLPFHVANKAIPHLNEKGELIKPESKNGIKFETFVFDALLDTRTSVSVEIDRSEEFSPLKNSEGPDSPETVYRDQLRLFAEWFREAGFDIPADQGGVPAIKLEISPGFALDLQHFLERKDELIEPFDGMYLE